MMTFRPFFIYLASVFILIGCVFGSTCESCKSSADSFGNSKLYHTLLVSGRRREIAYAEQGASDAHDLLAFAQQNFANQHFADPHHTEHMHAMRLHIDRATQDETARLNILDMQPTHLVTDADLRSLKS